MTVQHENTGTQKMQHESSGTRKNSNIKRVQHERCAI